MALTKPEIACENVLKNLKISRLTFTVQETPFSAYVTIRKKFIPNAPAETLSSSLGDLQTVNMLTTLEILNKENSTLKSKLKDAENQSDELIENNESLKELSHQSEFDKIELVNQIEKLSKEVEEFKVENRHLRDELESIEKDGKAFNKVLKQKDKQLHDLEKANTSLKENLQSVRSEFSSFKSEVNRERKEIEKTKKKIEKKQFLDNLKSESKESTLKCETCDQCLTNKEDLRHHMLNHHRETSSTQTISEVYVDKKIQVKTIDFNAVKNIQTSESDMKEFESYPCHYCDFNIETETHLQDHIVQCVGSHRPSFFKESKSPPKSQAILPSLKYPSQMKSHSFQPSSASFSLPFGIPQLSQVFPYNNPSLSRPLPKCEHCGWMATCGTDLMNHKKRIHNDHRSPFEDYKQF